MSYYPSIPNASDPRAQSQSQILSNFQTINSVWAVNHTNLSGTDPQGMHDVLTIRKQVSDPTTLASQIGLYTKLVNNIPQLFYRPQLNGTPIQMTDVKVSKQTFTQQYSYTAGPFVVQGGIVSNSAGIPSGTTITLPVGASILFAACTSSGASYTGTTTPPKYVVPYNYVGNTFKVFFATGLKIPNIYYFTIGT